MSSLQQNWRKGENRFKIGGGEGKGEEVGRNDPKYTHVNK
jgi:hypothetical protein